MKHKRSPSKEMNDESKVMISKGKKFREDVNKKECRICQETGGDEFLQPCKCTGSIRYVHRKCLADWLNYTWRTGKTNEGGTSCTICGQLFLVKWERPHLGQYIFERSKSLSLDFILLQIQTAFLHLLTPCNHILLCWLIKILTGIIALYAALFLGRLEMWILSSVSFEDLQNSLEGVMDNILTTIVSIGFHLSLLFMLSLLIKIVQKSHNVNAARKMWANLRGIAGVTLAAFAAVILPGYKARLLMWVFFGVEWNRFMVNFGTGQNFSWHFSLGLLSILVDVLSISCFKWFYQDFKKYKEQNSKQIPCY